MDSTIIVPGKKKYKDATTPRPSNKAGQVVETPEDFFQTCHREFSFMYDLAADQSNTKCNRFIDESQNTFTVKWHELDDGYLWLNPPFSDLRPWARKCAEEMNLGAKICMLAPASVDSHWYNLFVEPYASLHFLNPRLKFVGHNASFPKPLMLAVYDNNSSGKAGDCIQWKWKEVSFNEHVKKLLKR